MNDEELNNLYTSKNLNDIYNFYMQFSTREELFDWSKRRTFNPPKLYDINKEANNDVIFVIPTIDYNSTFAKYDRDILYPNQHIIFAESGNDKFFNFARNCNYAIKEALKYNPKWIIVSNDDMKKVDDVSILISNLKNIDNEKTDFVMTPNSNNYFTKIFIANPTFAFYTRMALSSTLKYVNLIKNRFNNKVEIVNFNGNNWMKNLKLSVAFKPIYYIPAMQGAFIISSSNFIRQNGEKLYDEIFINGHEDTDLFWNVYKNKNTIENINYNIYAYDGSSFGTKYDRYFKSFISMFYFEDKNLKK